MIVVDTNVISYFWIPGQHTKLIEEAFRKDPQWLAPLLWRSEMRNVLSRYIRFNKMSLSTAFEIMDQTEYILKDNEFNVPNERVLELASQSACSAYDCEFIVLAEDLQLPLLTTDKQLIKHFPGIAISVENYVRKS